MEKKTSNTFLFLSYNELLTRTLLISQLINNNNDIILLNDNSLIDHTYIINSLFFDIKKIQNNYNLDSLKKKLRIIDITTSETPFTKVDIQYLHSITIDHLIYYNHIETSYYNFPVSIFKRLIATNITCLAAIIQQINISKIHFITNNIHEKNDQHDKIIQTYNASPKNLIDLIDKNFCIYKIPPIIDSIGLSDFHSSFYSVFAILQNFIAMVNDRTSDTYNDQQIKLLNCDQQQLKVTTNENLAQIISQNILDNNNDSHITIKDTHLINLQDAITNTWKNITFETNPSVSLDDLDKMLMKRLNSYNIYINSYDNANNMNEYKDTYDITNSIINYLNIRNKLNNLETDLGRQILTTADKKQCKSSLTGTIDYFTFEKKGKPTIILINAIGVAYNIWDKVISQLHDQFNIITWECRGLEDSEDDKEISFGMKDQIIDLHDIIKNEQLNDVNLVGWCSGAKLALYFNKIYPSIVKTLILIGGRYVNFAPKEETTMFNTIIDIHKTISERPAAISIYMKLLQKIINQPVKENTQGQVKPSLDILSKIQSHYSEFVLRPFTDATYFKNYIQMLTNNYHLDIKKEIPAVDIPTMLIHGDHDMTVPVKQAEWFSENYPQIEKVIVPTGTHFLPVENHVETSNIIMNFINQN